MDVNKAEFIFTICTGEKTLINKEKIKEMRKFIHKLSTIGG